MRALAYAGAVEVGWVAAEEPPAYRSGSPKLLDRVRTALRTRHMSGRTEEAYIFWVRRYILFHGRRHPATLGAEEVTRFLSNLAEAHRVSTSTQDHELSSLLFLYRHRTRRAASAGGTISMSRRSSASSGWRWFALGSRSPRVATRSVTPSRRTSSRAATTSRTVQELLGHRDVRTTMIYTHVLNRGGLCVVSPIDAVGGARGLPPPGPTGLGRRASPSIASEGVSMQMGLRRENCDFLRSDGAGGMRNRLRGSRDGQDQAGLSTIRWAASNSTKSAKGGAP